MFHELTESVIDIWIIWLVTVVVLLFFARRLFARFSWRNVKQFHAGESGASYALPYVLTFPFFVLLMALMMQTSLVIMCKIGTVYSAHAAARTAIVWRSADPNDEERGWDYTRYSVKRAATMAMTPFASSNPNHRSKLFPLYPVAVGDGGDTELGQLDLPVTLANLLAYVDRELYVNIYHRLLEEANAQDSVDAHGIIQNQQRSAKKSYITNKYSYAAAATTISMPRDIVAWNEDMEVKVKYRMAFQIPGTARLLGGTYSLWGQMYYRDIETTVTLPSEAAETDDGTIGIPYNPSLFRKMTE